MSLPMTRLPGVPQSDQQYDGMAHFAGTGPVGTYCRTCCHHGYERQVQNSDPARFYPWPGCAMYRKLTGRHGPMISNSYASCKYYELRTTAPVPEPEPPPDPPARVPATDEEAPF